MEKIYLVKIEGVYFGADSSEILICEPENLTDFLFAMEWDHHNAWYEPDEDEDSDECTSSASAVEYTPDTYKDLDVYCCGEDSFLSNDDVLKAWKALGYGIPKLEKGDSVPQYIKRWDIPFCQSGASWQTVANWDRQIAACKDVIKVLDCIQDRSHLPPLLETQLKGASAMAENEIKLLSDKLEKVVERLKTL